MRLDGGGGGSVALTGGTLSGPLTITDTTATETCLTLTDETCVATAVNRGDLAVTMWNPGSGYTTTLKSAVTGKGLDTLSHRGLAGLFRAQDHSGVADTTVTNMTRASTTVTVTANGHGFLAADKIAIYGVTHSFDQEVNGSWTVATAATNTFTITVPGLSSGTYGANGTVTNRPMMSCLLLEVFPRAARGSLTGTAANADDLNGLTIDNTGSVQATEAIYVSANGSWFSQMTLDGVSTWGALFSGTYSTGAFRIPNAKSVYGRNAAGSGDVELFQCNSSNRLQIQTTMQFAESVVAVCGTSTGFTLGGATNQKIGFYGVTPVIQPVGTTDLRTALINLGLYASGGASPLSLNGGTLTAANGVFGTNASTTGAVGIPNNTSFTARNNAGGADVSLFKLTTGDQLQIQTTLNWADGVTCVTGTSTGSSLAGATNQKLSFHGVTAVIQRVGAAQAAVATTASTNSAPFGYTSSAQADAIVTLVNELRAAMVEKGLIKGAA